MAEGKGAEYREAVDDQLEGYGFAPQVKMNLVSS